jgi:hypothetical protein
MVSVLAWSKVEHEVEPGSNQRLKLVFAASPLSVQLFKE